MSNQSSPIAKALMSAGTSVFSFISGRKKDGAEAEDDDVDDADDGEYSLSLTKPSASASTPTAAPEHGGSISFCDWTAEKCIIPTAPLIKCNIEGCSNHLHHVCQIEWQGAHGMSPGGCAKLCREHHPNYFFPSAAKAPNSAIDVDLNTPSQDNPRSNLSGAMKVSVVSNKKKGRSPIESTAHKRTTVEAAAARGSKKARNMAKGPRICPNARVVVLQRKLIGALLPDNPAFKAVNDKPPNFPFCGQVLKAAAVGNQVKGKKQHPIRFDLLPHDCNVIVCRRDVIRTLAKDEDEPEFDEKQARIDALLEVSEHPNIPSNEYGSEDDVASHYSGEQWDEEGMDSGKGKKKKKKRSVIEMEMFLNEQSDEEIKAATSYKHYYGEKNSEYIQWTILKDGEEIVEDVMQPPPADATPYGYNIGWSRFPKDLNYSQIFFDHFFPSLEGKAAVLDEYLASPMCSCHAMVVSDKIKFDRPSRSDPDYLVSLSCILSLLIIILYLTIFISQQA